MGTDGSDDPEREYRLHAYIGCTRIVNIQHQHHRRRLRTVVDQLVAYPDLHHRPPLDLGASVATNRGAPLHAIVVAPAPSRPRAKQGKTVWFRAVPYLPGTRQTRRVWR